MNENSFFIECTCIIKELDFVFNIIIYYVESDLVKP